MCTVSFIRRDSSVIITSNRDEHIDRPQSATPATEVRNNKRIVFPKDSKAGGTWFAADEQGCVAVLLNGAIKPHTHEPPYRKSRGLVLLDMIETTDVLAAYNAIDLENIEPFTVVLYQQDKLYELKWDGGCRTEIELSAFEHHIWSSVTLYTNEVIKAREKLFTHFIQSSSEIEPQQIHDFHTNNRGDNENGFIINRQSGMKTFSVTQAVVENRLTRFAYTDLLQQQQSVQTLQHLSQQPIYK